jgi:hypothetical protein
MNNNSRSYRMKQASSLSTDTSFQSISTPINTNSWGQLTFKDTNVFEEERIAYEEAEKVDFASLDSNNSRTITTTKSSGSEIFFINTGIRPYEQFSSSFCAAHVCCFLYTYIMAVGVNRNLNELSWWQYANSPDAPPLAKYIIKVLEEARINVKNEGINYSETFATNYNETHDLNFMIVNISSKRGLKYMEESIFNHNFTMWSAYYIPRGYDPIDNINVFNAEKPYIRNGTHIPNALVAMRNLGCVSVPASNNFNMSPYVFDSLFEIDGTRRNSDEFFIKITNDAFDSNVIFPNFPNTDPISINNVENTNAYCNSIIKNISKHARSTWEYQENNNFKIIAIKNNAATFIRTLRAGYPIAFDMSIINYKLGGEQIPFIQENGLNYVMRYTNINQKRSDINLECHAVVAVGFYLIGGELKYVRVRNSWGIKWGDNGHFWMPMSYIEDRMPDGKSYCTSFYTIALKTDIFPEIRKLEFKVPEIKIELLDGEITTKINLIDLMTYANISIENINLNDLQYKIDSIPNKTFNVNYYKDSNNSFLSIRSSPGACKLTIYLKNTIYIDTSVNLFWNLKVPEVFFTLINSVPPIPMSTNTRLILSPDRKGVLPLTYSFNLSPPSLSNSNTKSYFYLYRSIIRNSSKFKFSIIKNNSNTATFFNNIITIISNKPGDCTLLTECEDDSSNITLTTLISWTDIEWGSTRYTYTSNLYLTIKETIVKINSK